MLTVVGDAVAKPPLDTWEAEPHRSKVPSLFSIGTGGAPPPAGGKATILQALPSVLVQRRAFGSPEACIRGSSWVTAADGPVAKHLVLVDHVVRSPSGKADYPWAAETALSTVGSR